MLALCPPLPPTLCSVASSTHGGHVAGVVVVGENSARKGSWCVIIGGQNKEVLSVPHRYRVVPSGTSQILIRIF